MELALVGFDAASMELRDYIVREKKKEKMYIRI